MFRLPRRLLAINLCVFISFCSLSFLLPEREKNEITSWYDARLDALIAGVTAFSKEAGNCNKGEAKKAWQHCRADYKSFAFLIQYLDTRNARLLNGPDLLRIEEESPADSLVPHGFQVMERCIYTEDTIDRRTLYTELNLMQARLSALRTEPSRSYQFTPLNVFNALRTGVYGVIALDASGFDAPLSKESIGGALASLKGMKEIFLLFPKSIFNEEANLSAATVSTFDESIQYLEHHPSFNKLNRMELFRDYLNPLSQSLRACAKAAGLINTGERSAINMQARDLFAKDIFNPLFFAPNDQYLPTPERIALGKRLFFNTKLSGTGTRSCASCHAPRKAFTDGLQKPLRMDGRGTLLRNTPTLFNSSLQTRQFYDMRADKLENQLSDVVHNADEMAGSLASAAKWIAADKEWNIAFRKAYPAAKGPVDAYQIANAISSYVRSLISFSSPFDLYMRGEISSYPKDAIRGFNLFMGKAACGTCHYAPLFNGLVPPLYGDTEAEVLGVPDTDSSTSGIDPDAGRMRFTRLALHRYAFKTPTIRNAALTAPYMHNGVFKTLAPVIDFYNDGGGAGRGISVQNQTLPAQKLGLSRRDKRDIEAFIRTLTDTGSSR